MPFLLRPERHRQEITETLSKLLKRPVVIGTLSMTYLPPTLKLGQVAVLKESGDPNLQISAVAAPLDLKALLKLKFVPKEVELNHWTLTILRKLDGTWDIEDWLPETSGLSGAKSWTLRQVRWKEGEIHWVDPHGSVPQELVLSAIEGNWNPRPETMDTRGTFTGFAANVGLAVSAKGQFFTTPQWSADLQLTDQGNSCALHLEKKSNAWDIKGASAKWRLANALVFVKFYGRGAAGAVSQLSPLMLENWQIHVKGEGGKRTFEHSASISGGLSEVKGTIETRVAEPVVHAGVALKDIPVEAILSLTGESIPMDGKVTAVAKDFELTLSTQTLSTLKGQGYGELTDGHYKLSEFTLKKMSKAKTMTYVKHKFRDLDKTGFPLTKLSGHWVAKNGTLTVDDGFLVSTDIKAGWVGKLDTVRQGLDGYLRLEIREKDPKLARHFPAKYKTQPAYGHLQGTWQEWFVYMVRTAKIPASVQTKLRKAIGR